MIHSATGWKPAEILRDLTWQDVADLVAEWRKNPPLRQMFQDFLRMKLGIVYGKEEAELFENLPATEPDTGESPLDDMSAAEFTAMLLRQKPPNLN